MLVALLPLAAMAQRGDFESLYKKYSGREGYTTMDFTGSLLKMLTGESGDTFLGINSLRMIIVENADTSFEKEAADITSGGEFSKLVDISSGREKFNIWHKEKGKGSGKSKDKSEYILLACDGEEATLIYIEGNVDISSLANLSKISLGSR